jgi:hypothetical protein
MAAAALLDAITVFAVSFFGCDLGLRDNRRGNAITAVASRKRQSQFF